MKNYLFSDSVNNDAKSLLKKDLINAKTLVGIGANEDSNINDLYFYEGSEKYPSTVSVFKEISNIKDFKLLDKRIIGKQAQEILKTANVIFLSGGDPFMQLDYIKDNGLDIILKSFKGLVVGMSAGSMNQCKTGYCSKDEDYPETKTYEGLNLVDVVIEPHYDILNEEQVSEIKKWSESIPIIGLPNGSFIIVDNNEVTIFGESYQYYNQHKIK
ncbi:MAG: Type 1 glutamine amidotransferase-like domain-containing protein [Bacilli bacterium]|nr:Type 1 glutamine amidotransferase-like domain-containing protein [Bacilli bacterium]